MKLIVTSLIAVTFASVSNAQNRFPTPIPTSNISVNIEEFATIPDSSNRQPPRISLLTTDPTGRLFANDQRGPMYTIDSSGSEVTEYLDLRDFSDLRIVSTSEAGFQGFAFHPEFANEGADGFGRLYTIHSSSDTSSSPDFDPGGGTAFHTLLLEWQTNTPSAPTFTPTNADQPYREVLRFDQPFGNHNAGIVAFNNSVDANDSDYGNLYVAMGDGGSGGDPLDNGQDPRNPYAAILRIDPLGIDGVNGQYGIVSDNVLAADENDQTLGEIFAYGLRNPQRFGWDTATGNMFIADIGQNAVEEINLAANGANFGWDDREGSFRFDSNNTDGLTDPVAEYDHTNVVRDPPTNIGNRAITVGEVARGTGIPQLDGNLLLSDFPTGLIFTLDVDNDPLDGGQDALFELQPLDADQQPVRLLDLINRTRSERGLSRATRADLRFGINTPGEVYISNKQDGVIRRLVAASLQGDFDGDGTLDVDDINLLVTESAGGTNNPIFDLDGDNAVNKSDVAVWARDLRNTWIGDANLDGEFNTGDLTTIFQAAKFETGEVANWSEGDWTGDLRFGTEDLVAAFQDGGFEQGARAIVTVPEPCFPAFIIGILVAAIPRRRVA
ncbi:PQQ-dependent sugar dehydrogenase [Planctomycetota bacterium]